MTLKQFTGAEVSQHNKENDLYIIIDGGVYDLSKFVKLHPGGKNVLLQVAGQDATEQFWQFHNKAILNKYKDRLQIGTIEGKEMAAGPVPPKNAEKTPIKKQHKNANENDNTIQILPASKFGSQVPWAEPGWYQGQLSPYYNETHIEFRKYVRAWVEEHFEPVAEEYDEAKSTPLTLHKKFAEAGLMPSVAGGRWPTEFTSIKPANGLFEPEQWDAFHNLILSEELAKPGANGPVWGLTSGNSIGLPPLLHFADKQLAQRVVPPVLTGDKVICLAITEPTAGSDVAGLKTTAKKVVENGKEYYVVNGEKKWITNGVFADFFTTAVRTGGAGHGGVSLLLIERGPGVTTRQMNCQGVWGSGTTFITFENVKVPVENLIGEEGQGFKYIMFNFNPERIGSATGALTSARLVLAESMAYAFKRKTFGKRLIEHPVIRLKMAHMARQVESTQAWLEYLLWQMTRMSHEEAMLRMGGPIALLKAHAGIVLEYCAREASQIFGGLAYTRGGQGGKVERIYRDVRAYAIPAGSEEIMMDLAVRQAMRSVDSAQRRSRK